MSEKKCTLDRLYEARDLLNKTRINLEKEISETEIKYKQAADELRDFMKYFASRPKRESDFILAELRHYTNCVCKCENGESEDELKRDEKED